MKNESHKIQTLVTETLSIVNYQKYEGPSLKLSPQINAVVLIGIFLCRWRGGGLIFFFNFTESSYLKF